MLNIQQPPFTYKVLATVVNIVIKNKWILCFKKSDAKYNKKVKYTPGKMLYQNNYETVNGGEFCRATEYMQAKIISRIDLDTAKINRLDMRVTIEFKESLAPLFDILTQFKEIDQLMQEYNIGQSVCWNIANI